MNQSSDNNNRDLLFTARRDAGINQAKAGAYFGVSRFAVGAWERDANHPDKTHRPRFITYLWDTLKLKYKPQHFDVVWHEVMEKLWGWDALMEEEHPTAGELRHQSSVPQILVPLVIDAPVRDFVGRANEVAEAVQYLHDTVADGRVALYAILGLGGVGKTQLAKEIAQNLQIDFPDGQLLIELGRDGYSTTSAHNERHLQPLQRAVQSLTQKNELPTSEHELVAVYRAALAGQRILILVDNAWDRAQVALFRPPVGCALIVTSREHIELDSIKTCRLGPLHPDAAVALLLKLCERIGGYAEELARLCAYLPLALRICGSLLQHTPRKPETLLRQLRTERLTYLVSPMRHPDEPTASVAASLRISYDALSPPLRRAMQQLSVFPASFTLEAATAVLEGSDAVETILETLFLRSMVEYSTETDRYVLHDLIREFCAKRLTNADQVRLRHAQYYLTITKTAEQRYVAGYPLEGLALFDRERVHIDAGWQWARNRAGSPEADDLLIGYDGTLFYIGDLRYDNRTERIWQAEAMRDAAIRRGRQFELMLSYNNLAVPYHLLGDYDRAITAYEHGLAIARELADRKQEGNFLNNMGFAFIEMGQFDKAIEYNQARIAIAQQLPDRRAALIGEASGMANLADAFLRRGDAQQALACAQRGYSLTCEYGDQRGQCTALGNMAAAFRALGEVAQARHYYEESIGLAKVLQDQRELSNASWQLGELLADHEPERALALMQVRVDYLEAMNHPDFAAHRATLDDVRKRIASRSS